MNINLELYKIFYYVAKNKSITRAANELLISQPAISKSIKTLETQMGEKLFIRKSNGVELSEKGKIIFPRIKESIELIDSAENDILTLQGKGKLNLNIAASQNMVKTFLMPYLENFYKIYPNMNIKISLLSINNPEILEEGKKKTYNYKEKTADININYESNDYFIIDAEKIFTKDELVLLDYLLKDYINSFNNFDFSRINYKEYLKTYFDININ